MIFLQQGLNGLSIGLNYALVALGLTLVFGVLHVINFGHGQVVMLGALAGLIALDQLGLPYVASLGVATVACGVVGGVIYLVAVKPVVRRPTGRQDVLLATFAVGILLNESVLGLRGPAPARVRGIPGVTQMGSITLSNQRLFIIAVVVAILACLLILLRKTRFGVELRAVAQSDYAARIVGINVDRVVFVTFVLSAAVAGLAGVLLAPLSAFSPQLGQSSLFTTFVIVVAAGLGSVGGGVLFAILYGILEALLSLMFDQDVAGALISVGVLLILLLRPNGLFRGAG